MATAQKSKSDLITVESSLMVTQNILMVLLSQLCFVRNIFPEEVFQQSKFGNCMIRAVQKGVSDEADQMIQWLEDGVFSLLQKGNLCMMVFGIYVKPSSPAEFVEAWYFRVGCGGELNVRRERDGSSQSVLVGTTKEEVKDLSQQFVRTVISLGGCLQDLPLERYLTMRIVHEDFDGTGSRPPDFVCARENAQEYVRSTKIWISAMLHVENNIRDFKRLRSTFLEIQTVEEESYTPDVSQDVLFIETENDVENMWESDSEEDSDEDDASEKASLPPERQRSVSVVPECFNDLEMNALFEISKCYDVVISRTTHENIFRFSRNVLNKMLEVGAMVPSGARGNSTFEVNRQLAASLYQTQIMRHRSPDIQMSQLAVASPASSTIYMDPPRFGTGQNDFSAGFQRHRTFGAMPSSSPVPQVPARGQLRVQTMAVSQTRNFASSFQLPAAQPRQERVSARGTTSPSMSQVRQQTKEINKKQQEAAHPGVAIGRIEKVVRNGRYGGKVLTQKG